MKTADAKKEHRKLKKLVTKDMVMRVILCADPFIATEMITKLEPENACALLDSVDILTAAFIVNVLRQYKASKEASVKENGILELAEMLEIQGLKGLCHARDQIYKKTGAFLV